MKKKSLKTSEDFRHKNKNFGKYVKQICRVCARKLGILHNLTKNQENDPNVTSTYLNQKPGNVFMKTK
jgi:hypothetical protein